MMKNAIIFGATGAIGRELLSLCLEGDKYQKVFVIARKQTTVVHEKLQWIQTNLDALNTLEPLVELAQADAFCCLGTTIKAAGSKDAFRRVDFDYVLMAAKYCKNCDVKNFCMISAVGASAKSKSFYSKTKGEIEQAVSNENMEGLRIYRPSLLKGKRDEFRAKEWLSNVLLGLLSPLFLVCLKKYQPINIEKVAHALYMSVNDELPSSSVRLYENDELQQY